MPGCKDGGFYTAPVKMELNEQVRRLEAALASKTTELDAVRARIDESVSSLKQELSASRSTATALKESLALEQESSRSASEMERSLRKRLAESQEAYRTLANSSATSSGGAEALKDAISRAERAERLAEEQRSNAETALRSEADYKRIQADALARAKNYRIRAETAESSAKVCEEANAALRDELEAMGARMHERHQKTREEIRDLQDKLAEAHSSNEGFLSEVEILRESEARLKQTAIELRRSLTQSMDDDASVKTELELQVKAQQRIASILEKSLEEERMTIHRIRDHTRVLEEENRKQKEFFDVAMVAKDEELKGFSSQIASLGITIEGLQNELKDARENPHFVNEEDVQVPGDLSRTEIYTRYTSAVQRLQSERAENRKMSRYIDEISSQMSIGVPAMQKLKDDHAKLLVGFDSLQVKYLSCSRELGSVTADIQALRVTCSQQQQTISELEASRDDLARQLAAMLGKSGPIPRQALLALGEGPIDRLNSPDLSLFVTPEELVSMLTRLREYARQVVAENTRLINDRSEVDDHMITDAVARYKVKNEELESSIQRLSRDNVVFKEQILLLRSLEDHVEEPRLTLTNVSTRSPSRSPKRGSGSSEELSRMTEEYHRIVRDFDEERKSLLGRIDEVRELEVSQRMQVSKLKVELEFMERRTSDVIRERDSSFERAQALYNRIESSDKMNADYERQVNDKRAEISRLREEGSRIQKELARVSSALSIKSSTEERLNQQLETIMAEKLDQQRLIEQLTAVQSSLHAQQENLQQTTLVEKAELEKELRQLRLTVDNERVLRDRDANDASVAAELARRKESELNERVQELTTAESTLSSRGAELSIEVAQLQAHVTELEKALAVTQVHIGEDTTLESLTPEKKMLLELDFYRKEVDALSRSLITAEASVSQWQSIAEDNDRQLQSLVETIAVFKAKSAENAERNAAQRTRLSARVAELTESCREGDIELNRLRDVVQERDSALVDAQRAHETESSALKDELRGATAREQMALRNLESEMALSQDAKTRYENELVAHAADLRDLRDVRNELMEARRTEDETDRRRLEREHETVVRTSSESASLKSMEKETLELRAAAVSLRKENQFLIGQLQAAASALPATDTDSPLNEVVERLRQEKELSDARFEAARRESAKLELQLNSSNNLVQDLRRELDVYLDQAATLNSTDSQAAHAEQLEEIVLLKENISLLRLSRERLETHSTELEAECKRLSNELEPSTRRIEELSTRISVMEASAAGANEEVRHWRKRCDDLLHKYKQVDPEVHENALNEAKAAVEALAVAEATNAKLLAMAQKHKDRASALTASNKELTDSLAAAELKLAEASEEVAQLPQMKKSLREHMRKANLASSKLLDMSKQLEALKSASEVPASTVSSDDEQKAIELLSRARARIQHLISENTRLQTKLSETSENLSRVNQQLNALRIQKRKHQLSTESTTDKVVVSKPSPVAEAPKVVPVPKLVVPDDSDSDNDAVLSRVALAYVNLHYDSTNIFFSNQGRRLTVPQITPQSTPEPTVEAIVSAVSSDSGKRSLDGTDLDEQQAKRVKLTPSEPATEPVTEDVIVVSDSEDAADRDMLDDDDDQSEQEELDESEIEDGTSDVDEEPSSPSSGDAAPSSKSILIRRP